MEVLYATLLAVWASGLAMSAVGSIARFRGAPIVRTIGDAIVVLPIILLGALWVASIVPTGWLIYSIILAVAVTVFIGTPLAIRLNGYQGRHIRK